MTSPFLFVGIDVSSKLNVVCYLTRDEEKRPIGQFTITNHRPGIHEFQDCITKLVKKQCLCLQSQSDQGIQEV